jgi:hypothetical protein
MKYGGKIARRFLNFIDLINKPMQFYPGKTILVSRKDFVWVSAIDN